MAEKAEFPIKRVWEILERETRQKVKKITANFWLARSTMGPSRDREGGRSTVEATTSRTIDCERERSTMEASGIAMIDHEWGLSTVKTIGRTTIDRDD